MLHTQMLKISFQMYFLVHCSKRKESLECHSSLTFNWLSLLPSRALAVPIPSGGDNQEQAPSSSFSSCSTIQWAQKWACICCSENHPFCGNGFYPVINIIMTLFVCPSAKAFITVCVRMDVSVVSVVYFYYVAGQRKCEYTYIRGCACASVSV